MKHYAFIYRVLIIMSVGFLMLQGCKKEESKNDDGTPSEFEMLGYTIRDDFDTEGNPKKRVTFQLSGTKDFNISFFSGDIGSNYENRDSRVQKLEELNLSFEGQYVPEDQNLSESFSVLASTNFNGGERAEDTETATWIDITDKFTFIPDGGWHNAGVANIADVTETGKPLYLALRQITRDQRIHGLYSTIRIRNWQVSSLTEGESTETLVDGHMSEEAGFYHILIGNWRDGRNAIRDADLTFRGNHGSAAEHMGETICWAISKPITAADIYFEADVPLRVKSSHQPPVETFSFNYSGPGEYNAVFVLSTDDGTGKSVTKTVTIIIPE